MVMKAVGCSSWLAALTANVIGAEDMGETAPGIMCAVLVTALQEGYD